MPSLGISVSPVNMKVTNMKEAIMYMYYPPTGDTPVPLRSRALTGLGNGIESLLGFTKSPQNHSVSGSPHPRAFCPLFYSLLSWLLKADSPDVGRCH